MIELADALPRLLVASLGFIVVAGAAVFAYRRLFAARAHPGGRADESDRALPPIVFPARRMEEPAARPRQRPPRTPPVEAEPPAIRLRDTPRAVRRVAPAVRSPSGAAAAAAASSAPDPGEAVQAGPIRFHRPPEGTLQLLPGRLQILSGNERREEIRFVRISGEEASVTFGRSDGTPHRHIQLQSRTVSRLHASMHFREGAWHVVNLSHTNPVVLNGRQLSAAPSRQVPLGDGDQIEMGEVVFRFRSR